MAGTKMARVKNVKDTIYLLIFSEPNYAFEISKKLYGKENKRIFLEIKKLLDNQWIEGYDIERPEFPDKRSQQRIYYQAKLDPIINHIRNTVEKEILFDSIDEFVISSILQSQAFRYLIKKNIPENFKEEPIDAIDFILTYLDILFIVSSQTPIFTNLSKKIKKIGDYEKAIENLQKNSRFSKRIQDISELLFHQKDITEEVKSHLPYLFIIPEKTIVKYMGFGDFGRKYYSTLLLSKNLSQLFKS